MRGAVLARQRSVLCVRSALVTICCTRTADEYARADRAATQEEIATSGVTVASLFFAKVFGPTAQKALTVFVALR